jgi:hypothetical protein
MANTLKRRENFRELKFEYKREMGYIADDAIFDPVAALREEEEDQAEATAVLKAEVARQIATLTARRAEIAPLHEASLEEAEIRALIVVEGRGSSISRLRLENTLDLALHRTLKRIDLLREEGRVGPKKSTQVPDPAKTCAKCENEPQPPAASEPGPSEEASEQAFSRSPRSGEGVRKPDEGLVFDVRTIPTSSTGLTATFSPGIAVEKALADGLTQENNNAGLLH